MKNVFKSLQETTGRPALHRKDVHQMKDYLGVRESGHRNQQAFCRVKRTFGHASTKRLASCLKWFHRNQ